MSGRLYTVGIDRPSQPAELHKKEVEETDAVNETTEEDFLTCAGVYGANRGLQRSLYDFIHTTDLYELSLCVAHIRFFRIN